MYKNLSTQTEVKVKKNTHKSQKNNRTFTSTATPAANTAFCCLHFYSCRFRSICEHNRQTVVMVVCPRLCVIVYVMFWQNKKKKKTKILTSASTGFGFCTKTMMTAWLHASNSNHHRHSTWHRVVKIDVWKITFPFFAEIYLHTHSLTSIKLTRCKKTTISTNRVELHALMTFAFFFFSSIVSCNYLLE